MQNPHMHSVHMQAQAHQQGMGQPQQHHLQQPAPFCGVPGSELAAMAQASWGMDPSHQHGMHHPAMQDQGRHGSMVLEQPAVSLSAQAELELELSLRGSLLVQQQRRIVQLEDELQRAWTEIDRLRTKISTVERDRHRQEDDTAKQQPRYWTPEEHRLFMEAVQRYGWKDVKSIAQAVGTRTPTQVRTHAQKLFLRQQKETQGSMQPAKSGSRDMPELPPMSAQEGAGQDHDGLDAGASYLAQMQRTDDDGSFGSDDQRGTQGLNDDLLLMHGGKDENAPS
mmetsp:Transcript_23941/g.50809  ORF Transcript_23941/g.50809 Transcript_23941/m.50809 type:complete len:281 (-) Transcript_23941:675-1517(-)